MRAAVALVLAGLAANLAGAADAQGWLLGKRRPAVAPPIKVKGRYLSSDRVRASADGGDWGGYVETSAALMRHLAELTRARGLARFAVTRDGCTIPLANGADCWAEATMLAADQPPPPKARPEKVFAVAAILGAD